MALITTRFDAGSTAAEVVEGVDLHGRSAVVTGGASGIGIETARALALAGASVTLAVRDTAVGERVAADLRESTGNTDVQRGVRRPRRPRRRVRAFTDAWTGPLHLLVNNAGVMAIPTLELTAEGWERQFATNHLGHFALTLGLHDALAEAGGARIVSVSSTGHLASPVHFDDLHFERRDYDPWQGYGQSKTANVLLAVEATRRWADDGIVANALMPGGIMTNLQRYVTQEVKDGWQRMQDEGRAVFKTPARGRPRRWSPRWPRSSATGGHYLEDCNEAPTVANDAQVSAGVREWALDPEAAARLWDVSSDLVG